MNIFNIGVEFYITENTGHEYLAQQHKTIVTARDSYDAAAVAFVKMIEKTAYYHDSPPQEIFWKNNHTEATVNCPSGRKFTYKFKITKILETGQ